MNQGIRTLYSGFTWSPEDAKQAQQEGWDIFDLDSTGVLEIQAVDENRVFATDDLAREYCAVRAQAGSWLHCKALLVLAREMAKVVELDQDFLGQEIAAAEYRYQLRGLVSRHLNPVQYLTLLRTSFGQAGTRGT